MWDIGKAFIRCSDSIHQRPVDNDIGTPCKEYLLTRLLDMLNKNIEALHLYGCFSWSSYRPDILLVLPSCFNGTNEVKSLFAP